MSVVHHSQNLHHAPSSYYLPPTADELSFSSQIFLFFHNMGTMLLTNPSRHMTATHVGIKASYGHPSLSPSIFTVFSPHGICCGFEMMQSCESPKHPFSIFRQRFQKAPRVIVYDNACELHQYCLNREPHFFRSTLFAVDWFHWQGHVGCSASYCLNNYKQMAIKDIKNGHKGQTNGHNGY